MYQRLLDKKCIPTELEINDYIGEEALVPWNEIKSFLESNYDFQPELDYGGANYGWSIRYRRSGKSLCTLYPEKNAFTILIVLGRKEAEKALEVIDTFHEYIANFLTGTTQLHDGRWLWIRVTDDGITDDIKTLIQIKKKPKKKAIL